MKLEIKKYNGLIKTITQYFGASLIPMLLSLAANPLIAMNMSPEDYAITGYYTSFSSLLSPLIVFYMLHYYIKRYFEVTAEEREILSATIAKSLIVFSGVVSIICYVGLYIYVHYFNEGSTLPFFPYAFLTVFSLPVTGLYNLMLTDIRMKRDSSKYLKISLASGIGLVLLTLLLVVVIKLGAFGKLLAPLLCNIIFFIVALYHYRSIIRIRFDKEQFKTMLVFCAPLTLAAMLGFFSNGYDRVFLERLGNNTELGYYSVGLSMATYISVFQTAIGNTFQPDVFQSIVDRDKKRLFKVSLLLIGSTSFFVLMYIIAAPLIVRILTAGRYMLSVKYTQIIALSTLTSSMYYMISQVTIALGKSWITLATKIVTTVLSIAMFSVLITKFEYIGAAWGLVLSFLISLFVNLVLLAISRYNFRRCH